MARSLLTDAVCMTIERITVGADWTSRSSCLPMKLESIRSQSTTVFGLMIMNARFEMPPFSLTADGVLT